MKAFKYLLIVVFLYQFGNVYAQDTLRIKVMTYNIRFGELASLEELASHIVFQSRFRCVAGNRL